MTVIRKAKASSVTTTATGDVAATNVQSAIAELASEKRPWRPEHVLADYPSPVGAVRKCYHRDGDAGADPYLFYQGAGEQGVVRRIWCLFALSNMLELSLSDYRLRIYTDLGNIADFTNPGTPTADIPLDLLLGGSFGSRDAGSGDIDQRGAGYIDSYLDAQSGELVLRLPIPYSNGCLVQLWYDAGSGSAPENTTYTIAEYDDGALPSFPYSTWRLKCAESTGALAYQATRTFLNVASGAGIVIGVFGGFDSANSDFSFAENNVVFAIDGVAAAWESSSLEDFFQAPYFWQRGTDIRPEYGTYYVDGSSAYQVETYRWVNIPFSDGIVGTWANNHTAYQEAMTAANFLTLYYAP
jgi:hypothetical protein